MTSAIEAGLARCRKAGVYVGVLAPNDDISERHIQGGFDFVSVANDCALLFRNADAAAARFQAAASRAHGCAGLRISDGDRRLRQARQALRRA